MTTPAPRQGAWPRALSDDDVHRVAALFRAAGARALEIDLGPTRLRLKRANTPAPSAPGPTVTVASPAVGVFHPAPGAAEAQTPVASDTVLGHVKTALGETEVLAGTPGLVVAQTMSAGAFVEYGQPVFLLGGAAPDIAGSGA